MTLARLLAGLLLVALVGVPLAVPLLELFRSSTLPESYTPLALALVQTSGLALGTLFFTMPLAIALAALLFRTSFPGRKILVVLLIVGVFMPLPIHVSAWQALLGSNGLLGWLPNAVDRPWVTGLGPAILIQTLAALPWVTLLVGLGFAWIDRGAEESALLSHSPAWVLRSIVLRGALGSVLFAGLWLVLQSAHEVTLSDMLDITTYGEIVFRQQMEGAREGQSRAVLLTLPVIATLFVGLALSLPRLERMLPPLTLGHESPRVYALKGKARLFAWMGGTIVLLLVLAPIVSLTAKLGQSGTPVTWSVTQACHQGLAEFWLKKFDVALMIATAALSGTATALATLILCWLARGCRWLAGLAWLLAILAWAMPGPVIGFGLKEVILRLAAWNSDGPLDRWLYQGPSPLPILWAHALRFYPVALLILWPVVRLIPAELVDFARLRGWGAIQAFRHVVWPLTRTGFVATSLLGAAFALGEVAASRPVETPGWESFAKVLFDRMHYGVDASVAGLALLMLAELMFVALTALAVRALLRIIPLPSD